MNNNCFSRNLRRLRLEKNLTQEQLASTLGVSVQSVSRWECGNTLPDIMLLPQLARLYGVTVDDLYREEVQAYHSYAQRLLAVYEASGRTEDFQAAEQEFARMEDPTSDELRSWGVLDHYMLQYCSVRAQQKLEQAMAHPAVSEQVYTSAAQQKIAVLCDLGRGQEAVRLYDRELRENAADYKAWLLCVAAHEFVGEYTQALETVLQGITQFPEKAALQAHAGDICRKLKRYEEAFGHWRKALELDHTFLDAAYSMGFCYEEQGEYRRAYKVWTELVRELEHRGLVIEGKFPAKQAAACMERMK